MFCDMVPLLCYSDEKYFSCDLVPTGCRARIEKIQVFMTLSGLTDSRFKNVAPVVNPERRRVGSTIDQETIIADRRTSGLTRVYPVPDEWNGGRPAYSPAQSNPSRAQTATHVREPLGGHGEFQPDAAHHRSLAAHPVYQSEPSYPVPDDEWNGDRPAYNPAQSNPSRAQATTHVREPLVGHGEFQPDAAPHRSQTVHTIYSSEPSFSVKEDYGRRNSPRHRNQESEENLNLEDRDDETIFNVYYEPDPSLSQRSGTERRRTPNHGTWNPSDSLPSSNFPMLTSREKEKRRRKPAVAPFKTRLPSEDLSAGRKASRQRSRQEEEEAYRREWNPERQEPNRPEDLSAGRKASRQRPRQEEEEAYRREWNPERQEPNRPEGQSRDPFQARLVENATPATRNIPSPKPKPKKQLRVFEHRAVARPRIAQIRNQEPPPQEKREELEPHRERGHRRRGNIIEATTTRTTQTQIEYRAPIRGVEIDPSASEEFDDHLLRPEPLDRIPAPMLPPLPMSPPLENGVNKQLQPPSPPQPNKEEELLELISGLGPLMNTLVEEKLKEAEAKKTEVENVEVLRPLGRGRDRGSFP